jgi:hypothetical protein
MINICDSKNAGTYVEMKAEKYVIWQKTRKKAEHFLRLFLCTSTIIMDISMSSVSHLL